MRRKLPFLILLAVYMTTITGCWNYREINQFSIVAGTAVDRGENGKYIFTFEIIDLHEGGRDARINSKLVKSEGDTLFDAIRNALKFIAPRLYFGHMDIVIVSEDIAREGIAELLNFLSRDQEPRLTIDLLVSREKTAMEILNSQGILTNIRSFEISEMLEAQRNALKAPEVKAYQFINNLPCQGVAPFLPAVYSDENAGVKTSEISGMAIFNEDKLAGFIDEEETKYFHFIINKVKGGLLILKSIPGDDKLNATLEIFSSKTKVKPVYSDGKVSIELKIKTKVVFDEQGSDVDYTTEQGQDMIEKEMAKLLEENIQKLIKKVQKEYDLDIFGFGRVIQSERPDLWKEMEHDWRDLFRDLKVNVDAEIDIVDTGLLAKSIKVGS